MVPSAGEQPAVAGRDRELSSAGSPPRCGGREQNDMIEAHHHRPVGRGCADSGGQAAGSPGRGRHLGRRPRPDGKRACGKGRRAGQWPAKTIGRGHVGENAVDRLELSQARCFTQKDGPWPQGPSTDIASRSTEGSCTAASPLTWCAASANIADGGRRATSNRWGGRRRGNRRGIGKGSRPSSGYAPPLDVLE